MGSRSPSPTSFLRTTSANGGCTRPPARTPTTSLLPNSPTAPTKHGSKGFKPNTEQSSAPTGARTKSRRSPSPSKKRGCLGGGCVEPKCGGGRDGEKSVAPGGLLVAAHPAHRIKKLPRRPREEPAESP